MVFREVSVLEVKEVVRLWRAGVAKKRIASRLGLDVKTVRRYVEALEAIDVGSETDLDVVTGVLLERLSARPERPRGAGWDVCVAHKEFIASLVGRGVRLTKICKLLKRRGAVVSYMTLYRYAVEELGFGRRAATIPVADCAAGEEVQIDTGWVGWIERAASEPRRRFRAWIFTAVRSRHRFVYPVWAESTASAIEACEAAWEFFEGVFRVLIPDNTKAIVNVANALEAKLVGSFLEYSHSRGFQVDPTRVRAPRDKARVERAVQTVREDCFGGEVLESLEQAREHARRWCLEEYGLRRHSRTQRLPREHFEGEERGVLLPGPSEPYDVPLWSEPKVGADQHAQVCKALYSLPRMYRGRRLNCRADSRTVRFYDGAKLVKLHARVAAGERSTDAADFPAEKAACALRDRAFFERRAAEHGAHVQGFTVRLLDGPLPWTRMRHAFALFGLVRRYGAQRVDQACAQALAADMINLHRLRLLLERAPQEATHCSPPTPRVLPRPRYLRPAEQYRLSHDSHQKGEPVDR